MPDLRLPPANDYERSVLHNVAAFGWHCTSVSGTPCFSYTVGLHETYGGPELIMFGLSGRVSHSILSACAELLRARQMIDFDRLNHSLIEGYPCAFVRVPRDRYKDYVFSALWYYAELEFPLFQIVWPDSQGRFPWQKEADPGLSKSQPILGVPKLEDA